MQNLALKFAWLNVRAGRELSPGEKPRADLFIDLAPEQMFRFYQQSLTLAQRAALQFGFSETALIAVLNAEFDIDPERGVLLFKRKSLNARSLFLANLRGYGFSASVENPASAEASGTLMSGIEQLTERLWQATRHLYEAELAPEHQKELRAEMQECARQYLSRQPLEFVERAAAHVDLRRFCYGLTAEALFKGDAAAALFGPESTYTQAWKRKQIFRNMQAQRLQVS